MPAKYTPPEFVTNEVSATKYRRWLSRKAQAHCRRDRDRGNETATKAAYKEAIHAAVIKSAGRDAYTGEELHWCLIGQYDNELSKAGRREVKARFAQLPTIDHVGDDSGSVAFLICGWAVNDAKNDLPLERFIDLCQKVINHSRREA